jgi:hypothetical protein
MNRHFAHPTCAALIVALTAVASSAVGQQPEYAPPPTAAQVTSDAPPAAPCGPAISVAESIGQPPSAPHYLFVAPSYRGYGHFAPAQTYAYGWFGACAKPHAVFHWDYFDHRWIWW